MLEHLRDPAVLRNDILVAAAARRLHPLRRDRARLARPHRPGLPRRAGLPADRLPRLRHLGTDSDGHSGRTRTGRRPLLVAALCSLGAAIAGPAVFTVEYEPTPRAFALPLVICAIGLTAHRRYLAAGVAAACGFLYHPPTALGFLAIFAVLTFRRRQWRAWIPLVLAAVLLAFAAARQDGAAQQPFWGRIGAPLEHLQRLRASYTGFPAWPHPLDRSPSAARRRARRRVVPHPPPHPRRIARIRIGAAAAGPGQHAAFLAAARARRWVLMPQIQPMRLLLFLALMMQFAGRRGRSARRARPEVVGSGGLVRRGVLAAARSPWSPSHTSGAVSRCCCW